MASTKTVIIIAGPTAVGKTAVAIDVARHFQTGIISADSRQCYREMNIGVARPSPAELQAVPHYFIASHSIHEKITAASFEQYALQVCEDLFRKHDVVVMVGGTGLYIRAFEQGMDPIPEVPEEVHAAVKQLYQSRGLQGLQEAVKQADPGYFAKGEILNPQRLMRALEVVRSSGNSILHYQSGKKTERHFKIVKLALQLPKEELHERIHRRVEHMMNAGLLAEVQSLYPLRHLNALQTVGYKELFSYIEGQCALDDAVALIQKNTRAYAKRQMTWFRKDSEYHWLPPNSEAVLQHLQSKMG